MSVEDATAEIKKAIIELKYKMNALGRYGYAVDLNVSHEKVAYTDGRNMVSHEISADFTGSFMTGR